MISLHSHSGQFCRHAQGSLEDVVKAAIHQGFKVYGLSEHVPRYRIEDLYPEEQDMSIVDLSNAFESYLVEARRLKSKYSSDIELLIGLETEYISAMDLDKLDILLSKHKNTIDYIVGSVHHVRGTPIDFDNETFDKALSLFPDQDSLKQLDASFCAYFDAQYELLQRFRPEVIGHFDLCRLYMPQAPFTHKAVWERVERNVRFGIGYGALFEVNAAAFRKQWKCAYPGPDILGLINELGGRLTLSDDSHGPHAVGLNYMKLQHYLVEQRIHDIWYLTARERPKETDESDNMGRANDENTNTAIHAEGEGTIIPQPMRKRVQAKKWPGDRSENTFWGSLS